MSTHIISRKWCQGLTTPIFRSGDKLNPENYRQLICVTSCLSKLFCLCSMTDLPHCYISIMLFILVWLVKIFLSGTKRYKEKFKLEHPDVYCKKNLFGMFGTDIWTKMFLSITFFICFAVTSHNVCIPFVIKVNQIQNFSGTPEDHLLLLFLYLCRIKSVHMGLKIVLPVEKSVPDIHESRGSSWLLSKWVVSEFGKKATIRNHQSRIPERREELSEEGHCERIAKAVLLKVSEVNMWINHWNWCKNIREKVRRGLQLQEAKRLHAKQNQGNVAAKTLTTNRKSKVLNLRMFWVNWSQISS